MYDCFKEAQEARVLSARNWCPHRIDKFSIQFTKTSFDLGGTMQDEMARE